jgi:hypothetical protein
MTTTRSAVNLVLGWCYDSLRTLADRCSAAETLEPYLSGLGWRLPGIASIDVDALRDASSSVRGAVADVGVLLSDGASVTAALGAIRAATTVAEDVLDVVRTGFGSTVDQEVLADFAADVADDLVVGWLARRHPVLLQICRIAGVVEQIDRAEIRVAGIVVRSLRTGPHVAWDRVGGLFTDPTGPLVERFLPNGLTTKANAAAFATELRAVLTPLAEVLGGSSVGGRQPFSSSREADLERADRSLSVRVPVRLVDDVATSVGLSMLALPSGVKGDLGEAGPGLEIEPSGLVALDVELLSGLTLAVGVTGSTARTFVSTDRITSGDGALDVTVELADAPIDRPALLIGDEQGTRFEVSALAINAFLSTGTETDWGFGFEMRGGALVIAGGFDGFLASLLPADGLRAEGDMTVTWSHVAGLRFGGSASLTVTLPISVQLLGGAIIIDDVTLALTLDSTGAITARITVDVAAALGPFAASVDDIGLDLSLLLPERGGLSPAELRASLAGPAGLGLALDAGAVSGSGFLRCSPATGSYDGGLTIEAFGVGISALAAIDTQLPGGGWALFVTLQAEFPVPIQLGFGFGLGGVGGLLALNRTINPDALAPALRTGAADALMFPENGLDDIELVLDNVDAWFPISQGTTTFGPICRLTWGVPVLVTADLGVFLAIPDLIIAVMGSVAVALPDPDAPLLELHLDVLGVADIPAGTIGITASLHDSTLLGIYQLSGDMAFYASLLNQPGFVLSIGGYNPAFEPPLGVPAWVLDLRRMRVAIELGEDVSVAFESYLALTSNSVQFGGSIEIEASQKVLLTTYTARGSLGFGVLLNLHPFSIIADAWASVSISAGDKELFGVTLEAHLEGPKPWYALGRASFDFFGFDVSFEVEVGDGIAGVPREPVDLAKLVRDAFGEPGGWSATALGSRGVGVTLAAPADGRFWVAPDQRLTARQSVAPLNRAVTAFGELTPLEGEVALTNVTLAGVAVADPVWVSDWYAPAQFDRLDATSRLSRPSYELMTSGVSFGDDGVEVVDDVAADATVVEPSYEQYVVEANSSRRLGKGKRRVFGATRLAYTTRATTVIAPSFHVAGTTYTVVRTFDGTVADDVLSHAEESGLSYAAACNRVAHLSSADAAERTRLTVAPRTDATDATRRTPQFTVNGAVP